MLDENSKFKWTVIKQMYRDICNGYNKASLMEKLESDGYGIDTSRGISERTRKDYIKKAFDMLEIDLDSQKENLRKLYYERYNTIYKNAVESNDRLTALNALKESAKMLGLNEAEKVEVTTDIVIDFGLGGEEEDNNDE